jgi:hypothetical protein
MRGAHHLKDNEAMTGIQFVTDDKGRKVAVQIDLKKHRALWEDIEDVLVSQSRRHEKRTPLAKVKADLIKSGKLSRE